MPYIEIDIDLEDFETKDIIDRIARKKLSNNDSINIRKAVLGISDSELIQVKTLDDKLKAEIIVKLYNTKSLSELQSLSKMKNTYLKSKNPKNKYNYAIINGIHICIEKFSEKNISLKLQDWPIYPDDFMKSIYIKSTKEEFDQAKKEALSKF